MSISTSKRKREEECNEDENNSNERSGESSQENLGNGDTEIFNTLIPLMENLNVLKTCRLVCKSWNKFACLAMRKLPWVYYPIDEASPEITDDRLKLLVENKNLKLPSPFRNIKVCAVTFREQAFLRFLKYVRETTNSFSVQLYIDPQRGEVDPIELQTVLGPSQHNFKITQLFLQSDIFIGDIFQPENIRLPHLKLLSMRFDGYKGLTSDSILDLCGNLCQFSPLKSLQIGHTRPGEKLKKLMLSGGIKTVENLSLTFVKISLDEYKYVCERVMEFPCIKNLKLYLNKHTTFNYSGVGEIIEHFADSLESLTGFILPIFKNTSFPKLREMNYICFGNLNNEFSLPVERYPLLKRVTFVLNKVIGLDYPSVESESVGIEELSVKFLNFNDNDNSDEILSFLSVTGMIFPNVSSFSIVQTGECYFSSSVLVGISKFFPKLTTFELWVENVESTTLTGLTVPVKKWLEKGWPLDRIPRPSSLLVFAGLEKISFGPDVFMSEELILCCLSKMPKLQYLTFYLIDTMSFSAENIRDSIGHLKRITIVVMLESFIGNPEHLLLFSETERLRTMLPAVVEIRKEPAWPSEQGKRIQQILDDLLKIQ